MEVIEDGNIMDRIPILLQRDIEYYEKNHTVLSESVCRGVVGGRLDFPRNASFAAIKIVLWLEEEFSIAFNQGSGMFVTTEEDGNKDGGVAKTSDPDKFVQLAVKSADLLLEHLHMLVQEALDHADLPVLTSTLGAAALLRNSLLCYLQHSEEMGSSERHATLQSCHKRYASMAEAVGERVLDLHARVLALYVLQEAGGRARGAGAPGVQGWWLYMNGSRKDLWDTVPPRMAQRIFAGMLNETLTILTVRYCQTPTSETSTPLLVNDILNILQCVAQLLPGVCLSGAALAGAAGGAGDARDVRDVHAKCDELFKCLVYRGAEPHFIYQVFKEQQDATPSKDCPHPWFTFVSPQLFECFDDAVPVQDLPSKTAVALELTVLLAQPQPSWELLVKVLVMRGWHAARALLVRAARAGGRAACWPARGLWLDASRARPRCGGVLCTADGYCNFEGGDSPEEECARAAGALTYVLASIGSSAELKSTLCYALEMSGKDWASCLDKRQVWCHRRPPWLAGVLALAGAALEFLPPVLARALLAGASMYQTMSLALSCIARALPSIPSSFLRACAAIQAAAPRAARPVGGAVALQALVTVAYEETVQWAAAEARREAAAPSASFEGRSAAAAALAAAEALCSLDEEHKHTRQIEELVALTNKRPVVTSQFGLQDFPEFAQFFEEGTVPGSNAERSSDAAALTSRVLMAPPGRDSLRVIYDHLQLHAAWLYRELGLREAPVHSAPLLYTMFHIGRRPFDQYLRDEWPMPWSRLAGAARARGGAEGARAHVQRRHDARAPGLAELFRAPAPRLL